MSTHGSILTEVRKGLKVCAVFYGHPGVLASAAHETVRQARDEGFSALSTAPVDDISTLYVPPIARAAVDPDLPEHIGWDGDTAPRADPTLVH